MDYNSLSELTSIQRDEMLSLIKDPTGVPTIMNLAAFEYQRLENLLEYMRAARMDLDGEGSLIGRISLAFGLKDAPSIEHFVNRLKDEIKTFNDFKQRFPCTDRLVGIVCRALEHKLLTVAAGASISSPGKKPDSASGSSAATADKDVNFADKKEKCNEEERDSKQDQG